MPPFLALTLTLLFVAFLFRRDFREKPNVTNALWIPFLWLFIVGSRFLSQWLAVFGFQMGGITVEDGSPIDAALFACLIFSGVYVLHRRRVRLSEFFRNNRWITIYLAYCLIACLWSDYPFVGFKRWIKLFGQPVMVLVLLTEPDPLESFARLIKRLAYIILPVSICFIKYFPQWGRGFDTWTGMPHNTGITTDKNALGYDCMIIGLFLFWHWLQVRQWEPGREKRNENTLCLGLAAMLAWLIKEAQCSTALVAMLLGIALMVFLGWRPVDKRRIGVYLVGGVVACAIAEFAFGIFGDIIRLLGKDPTLTGRTDIWQMLIHWPINPIIGAGFEGFWLGDRRIELQSLVMGLNEAHNGYLETYLNLGILGLILTIAMVLAAYGKTRRELLTNFEWGRFRLAYLLVFLVYNWTEAAFRTQCFPFFVFFLIAIDFPVPEKQTEPEVVTLEDAYSPEPIYETAARLSPPQL